jgi:Sec-independent protein translocase protein TatA
MAEVAIILGIAMAVFGPYQFSEINKTLGDSIRDKSITSGIKVEVYKAVAVDAFPGK